MTKTTKIIIGVIVVVIVISGIWWTASKDTVREKSIKIGAILPLTGNLSFVGQEVRNSLVLTAEKINASNRQKVEIIFEDSKMDPKEGVTAINKLKDINGAKNVIVWGTPVVTAIQPITEANNMVLMAVSISPAILKDKNYTFRVFYNLEQALDEFTEFIKQGNFSRVVALHQSGEAFERQVQGLKNDGVNFVTEEKFELGEKDFRTVLFKIKQADPDLIVLLAYGTHFPVLFKQIKEMGMDDILVLGGLDFMEVPKENLGIYEQAVFVVTAFNAKPPERALQFIQEYRTRFNLEPSHQAAYANDMLSLLYKNTVKSNNVPENTAALLKSVDNYDGMSGQIDILPNGDTLGTLFFAKYENGKVVPYKK